MTRVFNLFRVLDGSSSPDVPDIQVEDPHGNVSKALVSPVSHERRRRSRARVEEWSKTLSFDGIKLLHLLFESVLKLL